MDRSVCGLLGTEPHTRRWAMGQEANLHLYLQLLPVHVTTWVPFSVTWAAALDSHRSVRSDQISCSVMSNTLWHHELQHTRPPCPSPTPVVHSNSCPSSRWCHLAISSSVVPYWILKMFAIPFSSGPHSVRPLHHDPPVLGSPTRHGLVSLS